MSATLSDIFKNPLTGLSRGLFITSARAAGHTKAAATEFYNQQSTSQIHRVVKPVFNTIVARPGSWAIDLTFYNDYAGLPANRKKTGILVCLEQTSRFIFARPIRTKSPEEIAPLLAELFATKHPVTNFCSDDGTEWQGAVAELFKKHGVDHYASARKGATARVERFNRTLRDKIARWFTQSGTHAWVDVLPQLIEGHNTTPSRVLNGYTPLQVISNPQLMAEVNGSDSMHNMAAAEVNETFAIGDRVRTLIKKNLFDKKTGARWSAKIKTIHSHDGTLFRVLGSSGAVEKRRFAGWELMKANDEPEETIDETVVTDQVVDIPAVRKNKRVKYQLAREQIDSSNVVDKARASRGRLPARFRD